MRQMLEKTMFDAQSTGCEASPRIYSPSVEPLMQSLMATLANIDCEHELEVAKLGRSIAPVSVKARVRAGLNQRHEERRERYARDLAMLEQRVLSQAA